MDDVIFTYFNWNSSVLSNYLFVKPSPLKSRDQIRTPQKANCSNQVCLNAIKLNSHKQVTLESLRQIYPTHNTHILFVLLFICAYKCTSFKRDTQHMYLCCSGRKKRYACSGILLKNNIFHSWSIINKVSLACLMVSGDSPTRVHLCASSCHQERSYLPIPYLYLILMLHTGRMRLEIKEQRQTPKRLLVWMQAGCHLLSKIQEKTSPKCRNFLVKFKPCCCLSGQIHSRSIYFPGCICLSLYV